MKIPTKMLRLKGFRFPREVVVYAVWTYHRFALSKGDIEDLLTERGVAVSRETVRKWVNCFGPHFADYIKRDRPAASDKLHLDKVVIPINGQNFWLWRAGDVLDILVQKRRSAKSGKRFLQRLLDRFDAPSVVIADKLLSYIKPIRSLASSADHGANKGLNNRIAQTEPTRKREKRMGRFRSPRKAQRFLAAHDKTNIVIRPRRYRISTISWRHARFDAFDLRKAYACEMTA